ncbi:GMC family oxidoreductase [Paraburkholderia silvatlantica]|uniref:GMC family oxidoreductase n=1 Tax=Paraburkholderia silvatlantica TaxID=321895 RepID=UPI0037511225
MTQNFDYIIVGAGSAGCVLARRLSADPQSRVLVLEAGGDDRDVRVHIPLTAASLWFDPAFNWGYASEPEGCCDERRIPIPRGKLLGGSSSINGMFYVRGHPLDYDHWARSGAVGWSYDEVLPYFRRAENHWQGEGVYHGGQGPLRVVRNSYGPKLTEALTGAAEAMGFRRSNDHNGAQPEGFGVPDLTIDDRGRRASSFTAFLKPVLNRLNLKVVTRAAVSRIVFDGNRAVGVEYRHGGVTRIARADREVILASGAINSPHLLMLSGIGPSDHLRANGVAVRADLPGVGGNLQDHPTVGLGFSCARPAGFDSMLRVDRLAWTLLRWRLFGTGPATGMPVIGNALLRTSPDLERPDLQIMFTAVSARARPWFPGWRKANGHMFDTRNVLLHPESRGTVRLRSADPDADPSVRLNLLSAPEDVEKLRQSVRLVRELFGQASLSDLISNEVSPGRSVESDADIDAYLRRTSGTAFHPVGTCAMGKGPQSVVDSDLRVHGFEALRVVDASVMPTITGGNTHAPVIMIAEKASDMILRSTTVSVGTEAVT